MCLCKAYKFLLYVNTTETFTTSLSYKGWRQGWRQSSNIQKGTKSWRQTTCPTTRDLPAPPTLESVSQIMSILTASLLAYPWGWTPLFHTHPHPLLSLLFEYSTCWFITRLHESRNDHSGTRAVDKTVNWECFAARSKRQSKPTGNPKGSWSEKYWGGFPT